MSMSWIVVANASRAQIYSAHKARLFRANGQDDDSMKFVKELQHLASRSKTSEDLVSDRLGNDYRGNMAMGHGTYSEQSDPKDVEADRFAREVVEELEAGRVSGKYSDLYIFATPHFHGLLKKHFNPKLTNLVFRTIDKDYTQLSGRELRLQIIEHL